MMTSTEARQTLERSIVSNPGINLQSNEVCYFADEATAVVAKNQNVGTTYSSFGTGIYGHGFGIHSNQGVRNVTRGTVVDQYPGHLYLTSRRIILVTYKAGFDIPLNKLTGVDFYKDGLMVTSAGKSYLVSVKNVKGLRRIIEANNTYLSDHPEETQPNIPPSKKEIAALKDYKELLDQGIITHDEFDQKKQAVLNGSTGIDGTTVPSIPIRSGAEEKPRVAVGLWIGFVVMTFFAVFCLRKPVRIGLFFTFAFLALGFVLHIDPLNLRPQKKMLPVAITWIICVVLAIAAGMLL